MVVIMRRRSAVWFSLFTCLDLLADAFALNVTDLGHLTWTLTNAPHPGPPRSDDDDFERRPPFVNVSVSVSVAASPGTVHGALMDAGVLPEDPLIGFNEQTYRWVALSNWTYSSTLDISPATISSYGALELVLEQVDTFASVELNGVVLATLDNSFARHVVRLDFPSSPLRVGRNSLRLRFTSALTTAVAAAERYPYPVPDNSDLISCKTWPCPRGTGDVVGALPHYNSLVKVPVIVAGTGGLLSHRSVCTRRLGSWRTEVCT